MCASPVYIDKHGKPDSPDDLKQHNCLLMRFGAQLDNVWHFRVDGQDIRVNVKGSRMANDSRLVHEWCLAGHGIMLRSIWDVGPDIASGALTRLLDEYSPPPTDLHMILPPSRSQPRRVSEFAKKLVEAFER